MGDRLAELEEELMNLYETLDERDRRISELEEDGGGSSPARGGGRGGDGDSEKLKEENDGLQADLSALREQMYESKDQITSLSAQLAQKTLDAETLLQDKKNIQATYESQKKVLEEKRKQVERVEKEKEEKAREHKDGSGALYQLELENQRLRQNVLELEENESELVSELERESQERASFEQSNSELVAKSDLLQTTLDQRTNRVAELERDYEELSLKVEAEADAQQEWEVKTQKKAENHRKERAKLLDDLEIERNRVRNLEAKVESLKDTTAQGEMQKQIESLRSEVGLYKTELEASLADKDQIEVDLENVYRALEDANDRIEERVMEAIAKERQQLKSLEVQVAESKKNEGEAQSRYKELEAQKEDLEVRLHQAEDWNAVYEEGHGLKDAVRYQKKLKADIKRRDHDLSQLSEQLGEELDKRKALETACQMLKEKAGLPRDFAFDDKEIKDAMVGDGARLEAENKELTRQIDMLEADRLKLMRQLRDNAAQIGEKGIRFWGLSAGQLMKVTEFATNLRDGITELPLDDRSLELTAQVKNMKIEIETYKLTVERLEREVSGLDANYGSGASAGGEMFAMKEMMQQMQDDNKTLRETLATNAANPANDPNNFYRHTGAASSMTPLIRKRVEEVLQEPIADMNPDAQNQFTKLVESHAALTDEILSLKMEVKATQNAASSQDVARLSQEVAKIINLAGIQQPGQNADASATPGQQHAPQTPGTVSFGHTVKFPMKTPNTPGGQAMLSKQLNALSLPPEEWAEEVRELNGQLIEALEQLSDREKELDDHEELLRRYEGHLGAMRQQTALLYKEHIEATEKSDNTEKRLNRQVDELKAEREALTLRVERYAELAALEEKESTNPSSVHKALRDLTRRVTVHEVNEQQLARKYGSQQEQLKVEAEARVRAEKNLVEIEATTSKRTLYLEQYKAQAVELTERLQRQLEKSVPDVEHKKVLRELELLREDYLDLLHKEADVRLRLTEQKELPRKLKRYQHKADELQLALTKAEADCKASTDELEHQKMLTMMASSTNQNQDINTLVQEAARFRGEAARLELEHKSGVETVKKLTQRAVELSTENDALRERLRVSDSHERHGRTLAEAARRKCLEVENKFEGGLTSTEATEVLAKQEFLMGQVEKASREIEKYKELADLASSQAASLEAIKSDHAEQVIDMQEKCGEIESRTDDDAIIGRLQRQLMVAKQGYKDSMRKNESMRSNMRRKEAMARLFETRLDKREEALHKAREEARIQISALRDALRDLAFNGGDASAALMFAQKQMDAADYAAATTTAGTLGVEDTASSILDKSKQLSAKVAEMSAASDLREEELQNSEDMRRRLESQVAEVQTEKEVLEQLVADLQDASSADTNKTIMAKRLIGLSEEVRSNKLGALQARRAVQSLKEEKRHLEGVVARHEDTISDLEEAKAEAETKNLLAIDNNQIAANVPDAKDMLSNTPGDIKLLMQMTPAKPGNDTTLRIDTTQVGGGSVGPVTLDEDDTLGVAQEFDDARARRIRAQLDECKGLLKMAHQAERDANETAAEYQRRCEALQRDVEFFKAQAPVDRAPSPAGGASSGGGNSRDAAKMAEAAHTTISSLKQLIEEKNRVIEKYKRKLADSKEITRRAATADRAEVERLTDKLFSENEDAIGKLRTAVSRLERGGEGSIGGSNVAGDFKGGLIAQVEEAALLISEKDESIHSLELKLRTAEAARERAEARCGGALEEMERMKSDMITLAAQLQESEERVLEAMEDRSAATKIADLQNQLRNKETKMAQLRQAVVRLKQAFMESEEARAANEITTRHGRHESESNAKEMLKDEVSDMREQLSSLIEEMAGAKQALSEAKASKDKAEKSLGKSRAENEKLGDEVMALETEVRKANESVDEAKREKEEAMEKLRRAATKLKDIKGESEKTGGDDKGKIASLEKRIMVLTSQNLALRSAAAGQRLKEETKASAGEGDETPVRPSSRGEDRKAVTTATAAPGADKKLQRRIDILEKRLSEKSQELEAALGASEQARKLMDKAVQEKEGAFKQKEKFEKEIRSVKGSGMGDLNSLEEARSRLYELEEENVRLRRMAELEQPRTIASLRRDVSESKADKEDAESALKSALERMRGGKDGLRDSESAFMREEALREELSIVKKAKRDLEGKLLQRDGDAVEFKFEIEQANIDKGRLTRRVGELTNALQAAKRLGGGSGGGGGGAGGDDREAGGRFKRERDLAGVVDALKRVVEKLKGENERLRRGAADSVHGAESERKAKDAMHKAQGLQEENKSLRTRALAGDEAVARLAQRQEAINQLRRQMKSRDDEMKVLQRKLEEASRSKGMMVDEMEHSAKRTAALEKELLAARRDVGRGGGGIGAAEEREEIQRLERELKEQASVIKTLRESTRSAGGGDGGSGGREAYALRQQIADLKTQMAAIARDKERLERRSAGGMSSREGSIMAENKKLKDQNASLAKELQAFDLDFFEEIEDLKYKYNQAVGQLKDAGLR
jgi:chromosome segregation ATPase